MITSQNVAEAIVKLVAAQPLEPIVGNLVMGRLVNRDYERSLAVAGDTVNIAIPPLLIANNIAEGGTVTPQSPNLGNAQIVLNTHVEATFQIPDVTKILAVPDLISTYMGPAIITIVEKIETDLCSLYSNFTFNTAAGSAASITESVIDTAETTLFSSKVPPNQQKYLVVSAGTFGAMRQISRFTEFQTAGWSAGGPGGMNGILDANMPGAGPMGANGKIKDFLVFRSQFIQKPSSTTYNMAFARDGLGLAIRVLPKPLAGTGAIAEYAEMGNFGVRIVMSYAPNSLAQQFTVDCLYGCAVIRNNFGIQVQSNN